MIIASYRGIDVLNKYTYIRFNERIFLKIFSEYIEHMTKNIFNMGGNNFILKN